MKSPVDILSQVQLAVSRRNAEQPRAGCHEYIAVSPDPQGIAVDFWGEAHQEPFGELLLALRTPEVAAELRSLTLRGPDEGVNGTRSWDIGLLVGKGVQFPKLEVVAIQQTAPSDHNRTIVGDYEEGGVLAELLAAAPALRSLISPSAPNADFFAVGQRPLEYLGIDAGYAHEDFLVNLARSSSFPRLQFLAWGEFNETYMEDFAQHVTPFEHYRELFASPAFAGVGMFELRNPVMSEAQLQSLRPLRDRSFQFKVVRSTHAYVARAP
jgi:hypothetical protein